VAQLDSVVYVVCAESSAILKYSADSLRPLGAAIHVEGMKCPMDMVVCRYDRHLYVADYNSCIWRVSAVDNHSYVKWLPTPSATHPFHVTTLSVTSRRLLVTSYPPSLRQYTTGDGKLVHDVRLPEYVEELNHGIETSRGTFVIGHRGTSKNKELWAVSKLFTSDRGRLSL